MLQLGISGFTWDDLFLPERLAELGTRINDLIQEYVETPDSGPGAQSGFVFAHGVPARP